MPRVKRGTAHIKHRKNILKATKGFAWGRKNKIKLARTAARKAGVHAFNDRRLKKRDARATWTIRINAATRSHGISYSRFIAELKKKHITIDRKILAEIAIEYPKVFSEIVALVK